MNVLVTGGVGSVGSAVVQRLLQNGYTLHIIDRKQDADVPAGATYAMCDINDYAAVRTQIRGCDAVVHLAAIPAPMVASGDEVFRINAAGTFNVFQAAAEEGIRRVVQASSINAAGFYYGVVNVEPQYLPIDEAHPPYTTDAYSLSKHMVEQIGEYFWRRDGISSVALRFPAVLSAASRDRILQRQVANRAGIQRVEAMTAEERRRWLDDVLQQIAALRSQRMMEKPAFSRRLYGPQADLPEDLRWILLSRGNFWALIDERDAAQAVERGLEAEYTGAHALFVNDRHNSAGIEAERLAELFFPSVTARKRPLVGREALVSIDRARDLIGFAPEFTFG